MLFRAGLDCNFLCQWPRDQTVLYQMQLTSSNIECFSGQLGLQLSIFCKNFRVIGLNIIILDNTL